MENKINKAYSYHTFLFPFIWNKNKNLNISQFAALLDSDGNEKWEEDDYTNISSDRITDAEFYGLMQYFKKDAASILLKPQNEYKDSIKKYCFCVSGKRNYARTETSESAGKYMIYKEIKGENVRYDLDINQIRLTVLDIGVALMSIELEYWGDKAVLSADGKTETELLNSRSIDDVNCINEHGRRICLPYVGEDECHSLVADKIRIKIGSFDKEEDFRKTIAEFNENPTEKTLSLGFMMAPIKCLLSDKGIFTADHSEAEKYDEKYFIEPVIDDRMYVCCLLADDDISASLSDKNEEDGEYLVYTNQELYKLAFIEKSISCPSHDMMESILKRCIYNRWTEWGTTDVITHHSFIRVTSSEATLPINVFLTHYVRMAELAVIQRATLIALENECFTGGPKEISNIQKKYVNAQQTILLDECTVQEQGIEEFDMIRAELGIKQRTESLDKRLKDLYELANLANDKTQNKLITFLTIAGTFLAVVGTALAVIQCYLGWLPFK